MHPRKFQVQLHYSWHLLITFWQLVTQLWLKTVWPLSTSMAHSTSVIQPFPCMWHWTAAVLAQFVPKILKTLKSSVLLKTGDLDNIFVLGSISLKLNAIIWHFKCRRLNAKHRRFQFPITKHNFWCLKCQKLELNLTKLAL